MMMSISTTLLFLFFGLAATTTSFSNAFVVLPGGTTARRCPKMLLGQGSGTSSSSSSPVTSGLMGDVDDQALDRIRHEYKELQEKLLRDLVLTHDDAEAADIEEEMIEKAAQAAAVLRHKLSGSGSTDLSEQLREYEQRLLRALRDIRSVRHEALIDDKAVSSKVQDAMHEEFLDKVQRTIDSDEALSNLVGQHEELSGVLGQKANEWTEQDTSYLNRVEEALETDPDLLGVVDRAKKSAAVVRENKVYMDKEAHRHDSLQREIEHAIDSDPDLVAISGKASATGTFGAAVDADAAYMEKEAHRHDSLPNEIEHSIDTDPDLTN